jgi:hypothetical protein
MHQQELAVMSCGPKNDTRIELIMKFFPDGLVPRSSLAPGGSSASDLAVSMSWLFVWNLVKNEGHGDDAEDVAVLREAGISGVVSVVRNELLLPFASVN